MSVFLFCMFCLCLIFVSCIIVHYKKEYVFSPLLEMYHVFINDLNLPFLIKKLNIKMPSGTMLHVNSPATAMRCEMKCGVGARKDMIIE